MNKLSKTPPRLQPGAGDDRPLPEAAAERLAMAEKLLSFGTWDWNLGSGDIVRSAGLEAIFGLPPGTFGHGYEAFVQRVHPDDRAVVEARRQDALTSGKAFEFEYRIIRPNGELRWIRSKGDTLRDGEGRPQRIIGVNLDVTDQKAVQQSLATNEARLATMLKLSQLLVFHQDRDLRYTWVANPVLGATTDDIIGRTDAEILGPEMARPVEVIKRRVMRTGRGEHREVWLTRGGRTGCFDLIVEPERGPDGRIGGVVCAATDITQRKLAESQLRMQADLMERLEAGVNLVDGQGLLRYTNPKFDAMFGYAAGELCGQAAAILNAPETARETASAILAILRRAGRWSGELRNRRKDGSLFWSHADIVAIDHHQYGRCWVTVQSDITTLREAQSAREAASRAMLDLANQMHDRMEAQRRDFAREVHDQIGATLTGIRMRLDALGERPGRGALVEIQGALDQALRHTRDLCSQLRPPMLDDLGLAATLRWYARDWSRLAGIGIRLRIGRLTAEPVDPLRIDLFRMVQELLTNVARHAGAGKVQATLAEGRHGLVLRIRDDGRGFSPGYAEGFGLLGIRERLRRHGGRLEVNSTAGGATLVLRIPPVA